jgi:rubrerythrin
MTKNELIIPSRRRFLANGGTAALSAAAVALLAGSEALAQSAPKGDMQGDIAILNTALGLEWEAIAAYQVGAQSGLLQGKVLDVAKTFQGHHKEHAELLEKTVKKLGGWPVKAKTVADYKFPVEKLKKAEDVLKFAAKLERGAASAYLGAIPVFHSPDLKTAAGRLVADESMHWVVLQNALGEGLPDAFAIS